MPGFLTFLILDFGRGQWRSQPKRWVGNFFWGQNIWF